MRTRAGPAGAILEPGYAFVAVAAPPLVRALAGDVHRLGRCRDQASRFDALAKPEPTFGREWSVTVQQAFLGACVAFDSSTLAQGALTQRMSTTSQGTTTSPGRTSRGGSWPSGP